MKGYWRIERLDRLDVTYERFVPGNLSEDEVTAIIQRLACKHLSEDEIIGASLRRPRRTALLETLRGGNPEDICSHRVLLSLTQNGHRILFILRRNVRYWVDPSGAK
jgi:hypothetical protein